MIVKNTFVSSFSCLIMIFEGLVIDVRINFIRFHKMLVKR
jgi:hypothetical protein